MSNEGIETGEDSVLAQLKSLGLEEEGVHKTPEESFTDFLSFETQSLTNGVEMKSDLLTGDVNNSPNVDSSEWFGNGK